jgi:hypothetical protein
MSSATDQFETDPRFPSGPWTGFFLQKAMPGKHTMELRLTFRNGAVNGEGRDWVGKFTIRGQYSVADGRCHWHKQYLRKHGVEYQGFNEGKGIWGVWEITEVKMPPDYNKGGFYIWPEGMDDPSRPQLSEEADPPLIVEDLDEVGITVAPARSKRVKRR